MASLSAVRVQRKLSCQKYINIWVSMMSGHGANPIFCKKKIKIGRPKHSVTPYPPTSDNISFLPYPSPPSLQSGRHMYITPYLKRPQLLHDGRPRLTENQSNDLPWKSNDWFLYNKDLHHEIIKIMLEFCYFQDCFSNVLKCLKTSPMTNDFS